MNSHELNSPNPFKVFTSVFGDLQTGSRNIDVLVQFQYNNATHDVDDDSTGTGSAGNANSMTSVTCGAGVGSGVLESHEPIRYRPGHESFAYFTTIFGTPETGVNQYHGVLNDESGFAVGYQSETFGVIRRTNSIDNFYNSSIGTDEYIAIDKLDGLGVSSFKLDQAKLNIFKISYGWLGIAPTLFWVYGGFQKGWILFGVIDLINKLTTVSISNPTVPVKMEVIRASGSGASVTMKSGSWCGGSVTGQDDDHVGQRHFTRGNKKSISASTLTNLLTIKSETSFQGKDNHVNSYCSHLSAAADGTKTVEIVLLRNATLGGTPAYTPVDPVNSVMSIDIAGTTVTGGVLLPGLDLGKVEGGKINLEGLGVDIHPGDTITVAALSSGASAISVKTSWHEVF